MTIADDIANGAPVAGHAGGAGRCRFGAVLDDLAPTDRDAVTTALHEHGFSDERLAAILTRGGHRISHATIRRHRLALCACPTDKETTE